MVNYLALRSYARPWSTHASNIIALLSARVAVVIKANAVPTVSSCKAVASISNAHSYLKKLSKNLSAARRATAQMAPLLEELYLLHPPGGISRLRASTSPTGNMDDSETMGEEGTMSQELFNWPLGNSLSDLVWDEVVPLGGLFGQMTHDTGL